MTPLKDFPGLANLTIIAGRALQELAHRVQSLGQLVRHYLAKCVQLPCNLIEVVADAFELFEVKSPLS